MTHKPTLPLLLRCTLPLLALLGIVLISSCTAPPAAPPMGMRLDALSPEILEQIRSFRVMAFEQTIYRCLDNKVPYDQENLAGFYAMVTFNWKYEGSTNQSIPNVRLYLPVTGPGWAILVEAYDRVRNFQQESKRLAHGCRKDVSVSNDKFDTFIVNLVPDRT